MTLRRAFAACVKGLSKGWSSCVVGDGLIHILGCFGCVLGVLNPLNGEERENRDVAGGVGDGPAPGAGGVDEGVELAKGIICLCIGVNKLLAVSIVSNANGVITDGEAREKCVVIGEAGDACLLRIWENMTTGAREGSARTSSWPEIGEAVEQAKGVVVSIVLILSRQNELSIS